MEGHGASIIKKVDKVINEISRVYSWRKHVKKHEVNWLYMSCFDATHTEGNY